MEQHEVVVDAMFPQSHTSTFDKFVFMVVVAEVVIWGECGVDWKKGSSSGLSATCATSRNHTISHH